MEPSHSLKRTLGLSRLVLYGAGTILGAGIYVLVGEVAGASGNFSVLAFLLAGIIVAFSAYSFALLARRYPVSAGPAAYVHEAFRRPWLATLVGYAIIAAAIVSSATIARGFTGYLLFFVDIPPWLAIVFFAGVLTFIAARGVDVSVGTAVIITLIEIAGLCLVVYAARDSLHHAWDNPGHFLLPKEIADLRGIALGAFLAFYACIGFEDMVNMAEEVKKPEKNLPLGIAIVLIVTTLLYALVTLAALTAVPRELLAGSQAPLALVIEYKSTLPPWIMGIVSMAAVTNGALIQIIMGSRVLYGMARRRLAPASMARIHPRTRIPHLATLFVGGCVLLFALLLPLATLAKLTSGVILGIFTLVNLALIAIHRREGVSGWLKNGVPLVGAILCVCFVLAQLLIE
jgi:amino acid transporter